MLNSCLVQVQFHMQKTRYTQVCWSNFTVSITKKNLQCKLRRRTKKVGEEKKPSRKFSSQKKDSKTCSIHKDTESEQSRMGAMSHSGCSRSVLERGQESLSSLNFAVSRTKKNKKRPEQTEKNLLGNLFLPGGERRRTPQILAGLREIGSYYFVDVFLAGVQVEPSPVFK